MYLLVYFFSTAFLLIIRLLLMKELDNWLKFDVIVDKKINNYAISLIICFISEWENKKVIYKLSILQSEKWFFTEWVRNSDGEIVEKPWSLEQWLSTIIIHNKRYVDITNQIKNLLSKLWLPT